MIQSTSHHYSTQISSNISHFICGRAHKMLMKNHLRAQALVKQSYDLNKQFPVECTKQLIELQNFSPLKDAQLKYSRDELLLPPQNPFRQIIKIKKASLISHTLSSVPFRRQQHERITRHTVQTLTKKDDSLSKCLSLGEQVQRDDQIQSLRIKKQRLYDLQQKFMRSEEPSKQNNRRKPEYFNKPNFTTDFNGNKIQIKRTPTRKVLQDQYFNIELSSNIREQRQQNKYKMALDGQNKQHCSADQQEQGKPNNKRTTLEQHQIQTPSSTKQGNTSRITFKRLQDLTNRPLKQKDNVTKGSKVRIPAAMSINLIKHQ